MRGRLFVGRHSSRGGNSGPWIRLRNGVVRYGLAFAAEVIAAWAALELFEVAVFHPDLTHVSPVHAVSLLLVALSFLAAEAAFRLYRRV